MLRAGSEATELDPYRCIPKRNQKYASECTEVFLNNVGGSKVSGNFKRFTNVEVVWFNGNRLSRIENLEENFRIREVYVQDNMLVSLAGLRSFKFLRVLLASNNQIRNLDKQLTLLGKFAFLNKLDLFGNPVAEEPDYRLRIVYNIPQVEILDRHTVKVPERIRADEVVPNLDKVSAQAVEKRQKKTVTLSNLDQDCFRKAREIRERRKREDDEGFDVTFADRLTLSATAPDPRRYTENRQHWANPQNRVLRELRQLTPWEIGAPPSGKDKKPTPDGMWSYINSLAQGKAQLNRAEIEEITQKLTTDERGFGRVLGNPDIFTPPLELTMQSSLRRKLVTAVASSRAGARADEDGGPLAKLREDPEATMPTSDVVNYLVTLEWPRPDDDALDGQISEFYREARRAEAAGNLESLHRAKNAALRLEGVKTMKAEGAIDSKVEATFKFQSRADVFKQTFLCPKREVDEATGRIRIKVAPMTRTIGLGA